MREESGSYWQRACLQYERACGCRDGSFAQNSSRNGEGCSCTCVSFRKRWFVLLPLRSSDLLMMEAESKMGESRVYFRGLAVEAVAGMVTRPVLSWSWIELLSSRCRLPSKNRPRWGFDLSRWRRMERETTLLLSPRRSSVTGPWPLGREHSLPAGFQEATAVVVTAPGRGVAAAAAAKTGS